LPGAFAGPFADVTFAIKCIVIPQTLKNTHGRAHGGRANLRTNKQRKLCQAQRLARAARSTKGVKRCGFALEMAGACESAVFAGATLVGGDEDGALSKGARAEILPAHLSPMR
jgi:hypothetical protein